MRENTYSSGLLWAQSQTTTTEYLSKASHHLSAGGGSCLQCVQNVTSAKSNTVKWAWICHYGSDLSCTYIHVHTLVYVYTHMHKNFIFAVYNNLTYYFIVLLACTSTTVCNNPFPRFPRTWKYKLSLGFQYKLSLGFQYNLRNHSAYLASLNSVLWTHLDHQMVH